jgi:hypothetical protein
MIPISFPTQILNIIVLKQSGLYACFVPPIIKYRYIYNIGVLTESKGTALLSCLNILVKSKNISKIGAKLDGLFTKDSLLHWYLVLFQGKWRGLIWSRKNV